MSWTLDASMRLLNAFPLPETLLWPHRDAGRDMPVRPAHSMITGYGKWLRETPYFPGLFELVHEILRGADDEFTVDWLVAELGRVRAKYEKEPARDAAESLAQKCRRLMPKADQPEMF